MYLNDSLKSCKIKLKKLQFNVYLRESLLKGIKVIGDNRFMIKVYQFFNIKFYIGNIWLFHENFKLFQNKIGIRNKSK